MGLTLKSFENIGETSALLLRVTLGDGISSRDSRLIRGKKLKGRGRGRKEEGKTKVEATV